LNWLNQAFAITNTAADREYAKGHAVVYVFGGALLLVFIVWVEERFRALWRARPAEWERKSY